MYTSINYKENFFSSEKIKRAKKRIKKIKKSVSFKQTQKGSGVFEKLRMSDLVFLFDEKDFFENAFYKIFSRKENEESLESEGISIDEVVFSIINFYSFRMLITHLKFLEESRHKSDLRERMIERFSQTHPFDSLDEFLKHQLLSSLIIYQFQF